MLPFLLKLTLVTSLAAHGADLATTEHCLGAGTCHETNPILARFDQPFAFGAGQMGIVGIERLAVAKVEEKHPKWALVLNLVVTGAYSGIALHNAKVGKHQ